MAEDQCAGAGDDEITGGWRSSKRLLLRANLEPSQDWTKVRSDWGWVSLLLQCERYAMWLAVFEEWLEESGEVQLWFR